MFLKRVRAGAGLLMLGGYHSLGPGGYAGTPLGRALPVVLGNAEIGQYAKPFLPTLTPDGARHPILTNIADFFPTRSGEARAPGLPPLDGCTRVEGARPGATVLATLPDAADMPVLAVQPLDRGRTAVFTADTTRKWQQVPRALDRESPFARFWGQMVRWLAGRPGAVEAQAGVVDRGPHLLLDHLGGRTARVGGRQHDLQARALGADRSNDAEIADRQRRHLGIEHLVQCRPRLLATHSIVTVDRLAHRHHRVHHAPPG